MNRRKTTKLAALATLAAILALAGGSAIRAADGAAEHREAGPREAGPREAASRGSLSYRLHCLNCHGESGSGDGPMADLLKVTPTDLTVLAKDNGGELPTERIYRAIDGREEVRGHGPRGMPVWGIGLQDLSRDHDQEAEVRARILDLVAYIGSLQAPPSSHPRG